MEIIGTKPFISTFFRSDMDILDILFEYLTNFLVEINFINLALIIIGVSAFFSSFSVCIKTAIYGHPKISGVLIFNFFVTFLVILFIGYIDLYYGRQYFKTINQIIIYAIIVFVVITGIYAGFYNFAKSLFVSTKINDVTATLCSPIANVDEVVIQDDGKVLKVKTGKMGVKKPRLDDDLNYFNIEKLLKDINSQQLTPVDGARLKVYEKTIKHYKNVVLTDDGRREINNTLLNLVKLKSKYVNNKE